MNCEEKSMSNKNLFSLPLVFTNIRLVEKTDKWCRFTQFPKNPTVPWGYVLTMPKPKGNVSLDGLKGYIIRTKKKKDNLLLQAYLTQEQLRLYGIDYKQITFAQKKKGGKKRLKNRHIVNIRNHNKGKPHN